MIALMRSKLRPDTNGEVVVRDMRWARTYTAHISAVDLQPEGWGTRIDRHVASSRCIGTSLLAMIE